MARLGRGVLASVFLRRAPVLWAVWGSAAGLALGGCGDNRLTGTSDAGQARDVGAISEVAPSMDGGSAEPYSIVVLPDTQYYASSWPDIFAAQTQWLLDNRDARRIAFVLHTGDIVDSDVPAQWEVASRSLHVLDGQVPYVITAGNHDYLRIADRMGMGNSYFSVAQMGRYAWFGGTFEDDHVENSFNLFEVGQARWLVLALEFGPRDETLIWADAILKQFPDRSAIVITHAYLASDNRRYDHVNPGGQRFNPHDYVMAGQPGSSINDGEEIWQKLIVPNGNVKLVFCGHDVSGADLPPGTAGVLSSRRPDGTLVHQMLANYQTCLGPPCTCVAPPCDQVPPERWVRGGNGFLRILRFSEVERTIAVSTYSPYLNQSLLNPANQFVLPLN